MIRYKEFNTASLFTVKSNPQLNKDSFNFSEEGIYPYFTRTVANNGILGYVDYLDEEHKIQGNSIAVGMLGMKFFYMPKDFYAGQFTKTVFPKFKPFNYKIGMYFTTLFNKYSKLLSSVLVRDFEKEFYKINLLLPVTQNDDIDFDYVERFISDIEKENIIGLDSYLKTCDLQNSKITKEEMDILNKSINMCRYKIEDLFYKVSLKGLGTKFNKKRDISTVRSKEFNLPLINAKNGENGIMYYGREADFESTEMSIDIVNDGAISTGNVYPQPQKTGVLYNAYLIKLKDEYSSFVTENILIYLSCVLQKAIKRKYGYDNKAVWEKVRKEFISCPVDNNGIDFNYMDNYIRIQKKIVISDIIKWENNIIKNMK